MHSLAESYTSTYVGVSIGLIFVFHINNNISITTFNITINRHFY